MPEFRSFGKIPRLERLTMTITEKIDGTNACVVVDEEGNVSAQSRKRVIVPGDDNYGFAGWVEENKEELRELGEGYHYGEWYGSGIQGGYGLQERRFALFNTHRWGEERPACCDVVPVLVENTPLNLSAIREVANWLQDNGSQINPEVKPEGVMVYVHELGTYIKHPHDPNPKGRG